MSSTTAAALRFTAPRALGVLAALAVAVVLALALAMGVGEQAVDLRAALGDPRSTDATIFWELRLPRALLGALVGGALAASGSTLQALLRNPLADPFVLGVSGGAALGAAVAIALGMTGLGAPGDGPWAMAAQLSGPSALALVGAALSMVLIFGVARSRGQSSPYAALLSGVIFNAFALAAITFLRTLAEPHKTSELLFWLTGAIGYPELSTLALAFALQLLAVGGMWLLSGRLNLLSLGDEEAASLGVPVERTRLVLLLLTSVSVAGAVALSGMIGFVGLLVPHLLRLVLGPDLRLLVPASALAGAAFLVLADLAARLLFGALATEPPVGVVTALVGGPFFLFLLRQRETRLR